MPCCLLLFGHHTTFTTAFSTTRHALVSPASFIATKSKHHPQVVSLINRSSSLSTIRLMTSLSSISSSSLPTKWSDVLLNNNNSSSNNNIKTYTNNLFPPLTNKSHKGSHGRIAIIGGSDKYTGAPYYAAQSALNCGADLVTVFCAQEAAVPIKCYSPELMVQSVYSIEALNTLQKEEDTLLKQLDECKQSNDIIMDTVTSTDDDTNSNNNSQEMEQMLNKLENSNEKQHLLIASELQSENDKMDELADRLSKMKRLGQQLQDVKDRQDAYINESVESIIEMMPSLHALCIGPGLGRHSLVFKVVSQVIYKAMELKLALVLDADALYMLSLEEYNKLLVELRGYDKCVMTPNVMEMRRLNDAISSLVGGCSGDNGSTEDHQNIIVQKGGIDTISNIHSTMKCEEEGGLKRSGGIGDVLAGTMSAFMAWNTILDTDSDNKDAVSHQQQRVFACWTACVAVKKATKTAYGKKRRSMSALDVSGEIGNVLDHIEQGLV